MTPINNLKQWFRNGLKPTQEQFWAWMDSYWHKNEKIPQTSIDGLDKSLENKAETTTVEAKANKDASGLDDDDIIAWKEALGVGELPSNIATVDKGDKVGTTHTKEQVVELLGKKLDAPSGEGTAEDYPYVVGVNAENESVKLPAGDLGKNVANSKPTSVAGAGLNMGAIWEIETNGFPLRIKGLPDKSADSTFSRFRVQNPDGQDAWSNAQTMFRNQGNLLQNKIADSTFNGILSYNPTTKEVALGGAKNIVATLQTAEQSEINAIFNILGGNYKGMTSPVITSVYPPAAPMPATDTTIEFKLYGQGLNVLHDGSGVVKIIDTTTNTHYEVGWNSISSSECIIYVPSAFLEIGKYYKIDLQNAILHTESLVGFETISPDNYSEVNLIDDNWVTTKITTARADANGLPTLLNGVWSSPEKTSSSITYTGREKESFETIQTYDLSNEISNLDNFSLKCRISPSKDKFAVGFTKKNIPLDSTRSSINTLAYGAINHDYINIIGDIGKIIVGGADTRSWFVPHFDVILIRNKGKVSIEIIGARSNDSSIVYRWYGAHTPQIINELVLVVGCIGYTSFNGQIVIESLRKWT